MISNDVVNGGASRVIPTRKGAGLVASAPSIFRRQIQDALVLDAATIFILAWAMGLVYGVMRP